MMEQAAENQSLTFSEKQIEALAQTHFGISTTAKKLPGEVDLNYHLRAENRRAFILKIAGIDEDPKQLHFQNAVMRHLETRELGLQLPQVIPNQNGEAITSIHDAAGNHRYLRLLTWVDGRLLAKVNPHRPELLESLGAACGKLNAALQGFEHPGAHRWYKWDVVNAAWLEPHFSKMQSPEQLELAQYFFQIFQKNAVPKLSGLRRSIIHSDVNDFNVLVSEDLENPRVHGLIDFGDVIHTCTVCDLAIAIAYAAMGKPRPLDAAVQVVRGFHREFPLQEEEVEVLYPLIAARLLATVTVSAINKLENPDNEYLLVSEKPAWDLLEKWRAVPSALAHCFFRWACGWEPCPKRVVFEEWVGENEDALGAVIDFSAPGVLPPSPPQGGTLSLESDDQDIFKSKLRGSNVQVDLQRAVPQSPLEGGGGVTTPKVATLDLSVSSLDLGSNENFSTIKKFERTIFRMLEDAGAEIGIGGYGEVRPFYSTDAYLVQGNSGPQWRTVHLGTDIWAQPGTPVLAPLDGRVHSFRDNANDRDYGPTIILEHRVSDELTFFTLYGHLSRTSLDGLSVGMPVVKGQQIATIGPAPENGNWPPHLHFQVMLDMLGNEGDFPGVAFPEEREVWLSLCPEGSPLCPPQGGTSHLEAPVLGKSKIEPRTSGVHRNLPKTTRESPLEGGRGVNTPEQILHSRRTHLGRSLSISYKKPLHIVRGQMRYLYDTSGRRYLDTVNNVAHVGHEHPRVVRAAQRQMAVLNTNTRYLHENILRFAEELLSTLPPELSVVHFVNSGSEANELALRMAKVVTGQRDMVAVEVGYHGNTGACIDVSSYKFDGKGGQGAPPHTHIVPMPDTFRGRYRDFENAGKKYAEHVGLAIAKIQSLGRNVSGFICESILSCGGQIVLPGGYLAEAYRQVRAAGGLCIADEVQVGFGRVGEHFWGFELQGVIPDIVTMGKPIGNGHPLAAVVTTPAIAEAFANGMEYFNTFGGNPVSCAIGREVLAVIRDENLQAHAKKMGDYLIAGLKDLQQRHSIIGDVRGHGLFLGFELVKNRETLEPATAQASYLINRMRELGVLMSTDGPFENVLKIKPPMCFDEQNACFFIEMLDKVLAEGFLKTKT